jgi:hypothetical protein
MGFALNGFLLRDFAKRLPTKHLFGNANEQRDADCDRHWGTDGR